MPSNKILAQKQQVVSDLAAKLKDAKSIVISNYQGLTVQEDTAMRATFRKEETNYAVVKNTIAIRALEQIGVTGMEDTLKGPTALTWSTTDVVAAPRLVQKAIEQYKKTAIKGGVVEGAKSDLATIVALAKIPPVETLYGQVVSSLIFPIRSLAMTLGALVKKAEETGAESVSALVAGAPAQAEEAPAAEPAHAQETVAEAPAVEATETPAEEPAEKPAE